MSPTHFKISALALVVSLSGCMSQQIANTKHMDDAALKQAANTTQTPQQICEAASIAISTANKEELNFYAPLHLEQASDALEEGQDQIKDKETEAEGVKKCFKVNKLVENGIAMKAKVKSSLSDALAELAMLKKVDAEKKFTDDIQDNVDEIIDLVKEIEAGKMNEAMQGQAELLKDMLELEIEIVTDKNLSRVVAMLVKSEDADADDLAEKTFEKAENELESARKFIRANYRKDAQVEATSALAMRAAKHAFHVAREVETLIELKAEAAEEKVLYIESLFERINKKFSQDMIIGNSLYEQSSIVVQRLDAWVDNNGPIVRKEVEQIKPQSHQQAVALKLPVVKEIEALTLDVKQATVEKDLVEEVLIAEPMDNSSAEESLEDDMPMTESNAVIIEPVVEEILVGSELTAQLEVDDNAQPVKLEVTQENKKEVE